MTTKWKPIPASEVPADIVARLENTIPYTHHGHRFKEVTDYDSPTQFTLYRLNLATGKYTRMPIQADSP